MDILPLDLIGNIAEFIDCDNDKCCLMMTCKWISKCKFRFYQTINLKKILQSRWFHYFTDINAVDAVPFPSHITRLTFSDSFDKNIENKIPSTVIHLTFGNQFDQPIVGCIPSSVKKIEFGYFFDQPIENCIPSNITHLKFGNCFNQMITNNIPKTITHLILGCHFKHPIRGLSNLSVTHLTLCACYEKWNDITKISSITNLFFNGLIDEIKKSQIINSLYRDNLSITFQ